MTTRIELTYNGADLIVTGEYRRGEPARFNPIEGTGHDATASEFWIASIEQDGEIVTSAFSVQELDGIEVRALEVVEDS